MHQWEPKLWQLTHIWQNWPKSPWRTCFSPCQAHCKWWLPPFHPRSLQWMGFRRRSSIPLSGRMAGCRGSRGRLEIPAGQPGCWLVQPWEPPDPYRSGPGERKQLVGIEQWIKEYLNIPISMILASRCNDLLSGVKSIRKFRTMREQVSKSEGFHPRDLQMHCWLCWKWLATGTHAWVCSANWGVRLMEIHEELSC